MTAAIHFETEAYQVAHGKPMGRHFAGYGFLSAFARHASGQTVTGYVKNAKLGDEFCRFIKDFRPDSSPDYIVAAKAGALKGVGCLFTPSPINAAQAWQRELHGSRAWSLCGVNHTLSSARAMDGLTGLLTAPVQPWDAIICTSNASRAGDRDPVLAAGGIPDPAARGEPLRQAAAAGDSSGRRLRAPRPVIQGIGTRHAPRSGSALATSWSCFSAGCPFMPRPIRPRCTSRSNASPHRHRVVLVECGWAANDQIAQAFADARAKLCPSVRSIVLDGREPDLRTRAWAAADVFCSLSDNIQETFGLTPIEAMAAGLPVVVTDWDGYKDTVRDGIDGFAVPTMAPPPGAGQHLAIRHALEIDSYDSYIGQASTAVVVDIDATAAAFERLASDPDLRRRMGANGAARAKATVRLEGHREGLRGAVGRARAHESGRRHVPALPSGQSRPLACPSRPVRTLCRFSDGQVLRPP